MSDQKIYWRQDTGSFLPNIEPDEIEPILLSEFSRHHEGISNGTVVSLDTLYRKHIQKQRDDCGELQYVRKCGSESVITDIDSLKMISNRLSSKLGIWIQEYFVFVTLQEEFTGRDRLIALPPERHKKATSSIMKAIRARKSEVDGFLKSIDRVDILEIQHDTHRKDFTSVVSDLSRKCAEDNGSSDRWFHELCENLAYYTQSCGFPISYRQIDKVASQHFESWVCPTDKATDRFADEIAAIFVRAMFEKKYG